VVLSAAAYVELAIVALSRDGRGRAELEVALSDAAIEIVPVTSGRASSQTPIVKGSRDVDYGHKLNLTAGKSGLILDLVIEAGNPADSERLLPMLERHIAFWGAAPRQAAADGGFASRDNLAAAKARGVEDMAFHKKAGLRVEDMVRSHWVYRKLRNFRAGIEAGISCLKRAYGLARCTWRGLDHFKAYVWSSVVAYNLAFFARLRSA
jgi:transposase, IS5 family